MSTALDQRSPVAKAGWLIGVFLVGWLAFLFIPWPWRAPPPEPMPKMVVRPPSKLQAVGLKDNPDWDGLPELFAIWADHAEWANDKARFAYWNPGTKSYSYYFEAVRVGGGYRFREIPEPKDDLMVWSDQLGEDAPIQFYVTDPATKIRIRQHDHLDQGNSGFPRPEPSKLPINLSQESMQPPAPVMDTKPIPEKK